MPEQDEPMEMKVRREDPEQPPSLWWAYVLFGLCVVALVALALIAGPICTS